MKGLHHWLLIGTGGYSTPPKDLMQVCGTSILVVGISVLVQASQREDKSEGTTNYNILQVELVLSSSPSWPEQCPVDLQVAKNASVEFNFRAVEKSLHTFGLQYLVEKYFFL